MSSFYVMYMGVKMRRKANRYKLIKALERNRQMTVDEISKLTKLSRKQIRALVCDMRSCGLPIARSQNRNSDIYRFGDVDDFVPVYKQVYEKLAIDGEWWTTRELCNVFETSVDCLTSMIYRARKNVGEIESKMGRDENGKYTCFYRVDIDGEKE